MRKVLKWLGISLGGLAVLLVLMSLANIAIPLGFLKNTVQDSVKQATGRTLVLDGTFGVVPGFSPVAKVSDVYLSNPDGFNKDGMASIESASAEIHLLPLLGSKIHVGEISISGVLVNLEKTVAGENNWTFGTGSKEEEKAPEDPGSPGFKFVGMDGVELEDASISYEDGLSGTSDKVQIGNLAFSAPKKGNIMASLDGEYRTLPIALNIAGPELKQVLEQAPMLDVTMDGSISTASLSAVAEIAEFKDINSEISLNGTDLGAIGEALGIPMPAVNNYKAGLFLSVNDSIVKLTNLAIALDENLVEGNLSVDTGGDVLRLMGNIDIRNLDINTLVPVVEDEEPVEENTVASESSGTADLALVSDVLKKYAIGLNLNIGKLSAGGISLHDSNLEINLLDGRLETPLAINLNAIPMEGELSLGESGSGVKFHASLSVENNDIGDLEKWVDLKKVDGALGTFRIEMDAEGETLAAMGDHLQARINIEDAELQYGGQEGEPAVEFSIGSLESTVSYRDGVALEAEGDLLGEPYSLSIIGGKIRKLLGGGKFPLDLEFQGPAVNLEIDGYLKKPSGDKGSDIYLALEVANLGAMHKWLGTNPEFTESFSFSGQVLSSASGWKIPDMDFLLGDSELSGELGIDKSGEAPVFNISIDSPKIDVTQLAGAYSSDEGLDQVESNQEGEAVDSGDDTNGLPTKKKKALQMPILPSGIELPNADFDIKLHSILLDGMTVENVAFAGSMRKGKLPASPFEMSLGGANFTGEIGLNSLADPPKAVLKVQSRDIDLGDMAQNLGISNDLDSFASLLALEIILKGTSLREILTYSEFHAKIRNGIWTLTDPGSGNELPLEIVESDLTIEPGKPITLVQNAKIRGEPVEVTITADRPDSVEKREEIDLIIDLVYGDNKLSLHGVTPIPLEFGDARLNLKMFGDNLGTLTPLVGLRVPEFGPYNLDAGFSMDSTGYHLEGLDITIGKSVMSGSASLDTSGKIPVFDVVLNSDLIQLNDFAQEEVEQVDEAAEPEQTAEADETEIKDSEEENPPRFTAKNLGLAEGKFVLNVRKINSGEDWLGSGEVNINLKDSHLAFDPVRVDLPGGGFGLKMYLHPDGDDILARLVSRIENFDYGVLARRADPETKMTGHIYLDVDIESRTKYLDRIMAGANGHFDFTLLPEFFEAGIIDLWAASLLVAMLPRFGSSPSLLNCLVARFDIEEGIMEEDLLILDTSKLRAEGKGEINFAEETIEYRLTPQAKKVGLFQVQAPIEIAGSFSDMEFGLDGGLIGTAFRMVATTVTVPVRMITGKEIPRDGSDVCLPPEPREKD